MSPSFLVLFCPMTHPLFLICTGSCSIKPSQAKNFAAVSLPFRAPYCSPPKCSHLTISLLPIWVAWSLAPMTLTTLNQTLTPPHISTHSLKSAVVWTLFCSGFVNWTFPNTNGKPVMLHLHAVHVPGIPMHLLSPQQIMATPHQSHNKNHYLGTPTGLVLVYDGHLIHVDPPAQPKLWLSQTLVPDVTYAHDLLHGVCQMPIWSTHWPSRIISIQSIANLNNFY